MKAFILMLLALLAVFVAAEQAPQVPAAKAANATQVAPAPKAPAPAKAPVANATKPLKAKLSRRRRAVTVGDSTVYAAPVVNPLVVNTGLVSGYIPYEYRRALRNVGKTMQLLDRSYEAVSAHLRRLSVMRAKVLAKYRALRSRAGMIIAPPVASRLYVAPKTRRLLKRYYTGSLAETEAETEAVAEDHAEEEAEEEIDPAQVLAFLETAEQASFDAEAEVDAEAEAEVDADEQVSEEAEAEVDAEVDAEEEMSHEAEADVEAEEM